MTHQIHERRGRAFRPLYEDIRERYNQHELVSGMRDLLASLIRNTPDLVGEDIERLTGALETGDSERATQIVDDWDEAYFQLSEESNGATGTTTDVKTAFRRARFAGAVAAFVSSGDRWFDDIMHELSAALDCGDEPLIEFVGRAFGVE